VKKMFGKKKKGIMGLMTTGIGVGVGSQVAGEMGATSTQVALGKIGKGIGTVGGVMGAGMVMDSLGRLVKKKKKW